MFSAQEVNCGCRMSRERWMLLLFLLTCLPVVTLVVFVLGDVWGNSAALRRFQSQFATVSHPTNTRLITGRACVGLLVGNGNHCDFFVGELRAFSGDWDHVEKGYMGQAIVSPIDEKRVPVRALRVSDAFGGQERLPRDLETLEGWKADVQGDVEKLYIVYVFPSYCAKMDPRCH
jgi:hypothetical protein